MIRALIDTDVILDMLLARPEFVEAASAVWEANRNELFEGYVAAITPVNVFYVARKLKGLDIASQIGSEILSNWHVCSLDKTTLQFAVGLPIKDYEDAVQHASATAYQLDFIVTRNLDDYANASLPVMSPAAFVHLLRDDA